MANFDAMFAGCESFMEGDVEINNDVTVPAGGDTAEALETEVENEDTAVEGAEVSADADAEVEKGEAANMVFDQVLAMYDHVKNYGVDRTFLSLYNSNGQLDQMVNYRFPSCESIDSVGSPRSAASRAFIAAMESDGIFRKIWEWIKKVCRAIANFFIKIVDWFRDVMGNTEIRIGKLSKMVERSTVKTDLNNDTKIKWTKDERIRKLVEHTNLFEDIISGQIDQSKVDSYIQMYSDGSGAAVNLPGINVNMAGTLLDVENLTVTLLDQAVHKTQNAAKMNGFGKDDRDKYTKDIKEKKHFDEVDQAKYFARKIQTKVLDKISKDIQKIGTSEEEISKVPGLGNPGNSMGFINEELRNVRTMYKRIISTKQFIDRMKLNQKHMNDNAEVGYRMANGESMSREASEQGRKATQCFNIIVNVRGKGLVLYQKMVNKLIAMIANHADKLLKIGGTAGSGYIDSSDGSK